MPKLTLSIMINDLGEYHKLLAKFQLQVQDDQETLFIRYGFKVGEGFYPCAVVVSKSNGNRIFLHKAGVGHLGDIGMEHREFLKLLKALKSKQLYDYYSELINNKAAA